MHWIDPDHLPETFGVVDCFLLNGEGEADGLVLKDGLEVHFPRTWASPCSPPFGPVPQCVSAVCGRAASP